MTRRCDETAGSIAPVSRGVYTRNWTQQSVMLLLFLLTQENFGLVETLKTTVSAAQEARGMMNLPGDEDDVRTLNTLTHSAHPHTHTIAQSHNRTITATTIISFHIRNVASA